MKSNDGKLSSILSYLFVKGSEIQISLTKPNRGHEPFIQTFVQTSWLNVATKGERSKIIT